MPHEFRPSVEARSVDLLYDDGLPFKDLNNNGEIDAYEDWRKPVAEARCRSSVPDDVGRKDGDVDDRSAER